LRRRKPTNLFIDDAPIRRKRTPIEIVQTDAAPLLRHEAHADDEAIRLPNEQFSFCASPRRPISLHQLRSDKMLFGEECGSTVTYSQPFSFTVVFNRTSGVALGQTFFSNVNAGFSSGGAFEFTSTAGQLDIFAGSALNATTTENVFHCAQAVFNGASSVIGVDGSNTNGSAGANSPSATSYMLFSAVGGTNVSFGSALEVGAETSADSTGTVCSNAKTYWGY
jgi:hypothetical protein